MKQFCIRFASLMMCLALLAGCEQLGSTEYAMRFWKLPPAIGGVTSTVFRPGETVIKYPIVSKLYRFDTAVRDISWGESGSSKSKKTRGSGYVQTRALDGNEVALAVTVSYQISSDPEKLRYLIQKVGTSNEDIEHLVITAARADIRTYMNELETSQFIDNEDKSIAADNEHLSRYEAVDNVKSALARRLKPYGILIHRFILEDFEFRRVRPDGTFDFSYEERLKEIQQKEEETMREEARIKSVEAKKGQELKQMQAQFNQMVEEAQGFKDQATKRGDAYLESKSNESKAILATGRAHVEGLKEQITALSGPGGEAILKLELAKQLIKQAPRFVVMDSNRGGDGIDVQKLDANTLIDQIGVIEGLKEKQPLQTTTRPPKLLSKTKTPQ